MPQTKKMVNGGSKRSARLKCKSFGKSRSESHRQAGVPEDHLHPRPVHHRPSSWAPNRVAGTSCPPIYEPRNTPDSLPPKGQSPLLPSWGKGKARGGLRACPKPRGSNPPPTQHQRPALLARAERPPSRELIPTL